jgi:hypothetical protein
MLARTSLSIILFACGGAPATAVEGPEPVAEPAPIADEGGPDVRVRVADEAGLSSVDPAITSAMERAVREVFTDRLQAERMRVEAVLHRLSEEGGQRRAEVRVTILGVQGERICTVLAGGSTAAVSAATPQQIVEAAMRSALRNFVTEMGDCSASVVP